MKSQRGPCLDGNGETLGAGMEATTVAKVLRISRETLTRTAEVRNKCRLRFSPRRY
jgi:hypothetical protein